MGNPFTKCACRFPLINLLEGFQCPLTPINKFARGVPASFVTLCQIFRRVANNLGSILCYKNYVHPPFQKWFFFPLAAYFLAPIVSFYLNFPPFLIYIMVPFYSHFIFFYPLFSFFPFSLPLHIFSPKWHSADISVHHFQICRPLQ